MLRCTAKVLALLGVSEPAIGEACEQDWYAHLIRTDRRKCLLVTHAGTLFSVFMPNVTAVGPPVVSAIQAALQAEHLPIDTLGELDPWQVAVAKTADRRILGTINDLAFTTEHVIATTGGLARCNINALHHGLHRTINSITGYIPPIDLVTASHPRPAVKAVRCGQVDPDTYSGADPLFETYRRRNPRSLRDGRDGIGLVGVATRGGGRRPQFSGWVEE